MVKLPQVLDQHNNQYDDQCNQRNIVENYDRTSEKTEYRAEYACADACTAYSPCARCSAHEADKRYNSFGYYSGYNIADADNGHDDVDL